MGIMNLKAQDRICKFLRFTKLIALIFTLCIMSCVTAYAETVSTTYIDENGNTQTVDATALTGDERLLPEGWYVVKENISYNNRTLLLGPNADVRIILANGGTMSINNAPSRGIQCNDSGLGHLYIYGQKNGSGTLTINSAGTGIRVTNYTQNGGTVNITTGGTSANGIFAASTVKINGGNLTINSSGHAIYAGDYAGGTGYKGYITINDGQVSAEKGFRAGPRDTVYTRSFIGEITLGLASSDSYIKAGYFEAGTVKVAENESLFVEDTPNVLYSGTLTSTQISAIAGKTLKRGNLYSYIDADGIRRYTYATPITSSTTTQTLSESWYIVKEDVTITNSTTAGSSTAFRLTGSAVNIILADNATLTIGSTGNQFAGGLVGSANLNIYGQDNQTGTLEIYAYTPIDAGTVFTQNGGNIILSANSGIGTYACGIHAGQKVNINNGTLSMDIKGSSTSRAINVGHGAYGQKFAGSITISGGKVKVSGAELYAGYSTGTVESTITLGYRNITDYISVTSCDAAIVKVADGQVLAVSGDTTTYTGDITGSKNAIVGKILVPYEVHTISYDYGLNNGESLLDEGYIMLVSLDESASGVSFTIDDAEQGVFKLSEDTYIALLASSDLSASKFTLKAASGTTTSFIFVSENPADDLTPGTHDIRLNSNTTKGTYIIAGLNAGNLNPGAYSTSALPLTLLNPERKGYTFAGWTDKDAQTTPTTTYTITANTAKNLELTANWTLTSYDIEYELDGGTKSDDLTRYSVLTETFTLNNPTKDGYTFLGWEGTGLNGAVQSVTIPKGSTGNRKYTAMWRKSFTPSGSKPEIVQHAMILGSQIVVMFYVYYPENYIPANYNMGFVISGDLSENPNPIAYTESSDLDGSTVYAYPCYVNSIQMADTIHATLYDNAETPGVVLSEDYTAKTYLDRVIASADVFSSETVKLCEAIKNYGSYVQPPLAAENKWVIGTDHVKMDSVDTYGDDDVLLAKQATKDYALSKSLDSLSFSYALYLDSKTTLQVIFSNDVTNIKCESTDNIADNVVTIANISAHELGNMYTITGTKDSNSSFTVTISPLSYVYSVLSEEKSNVNGIKYGVTSLYNYYDRTMKYRNSHSSDYSDEGTD